MSGALKVFDGLQWKPTGVVINQNITQYVSPYNYADNSDFTQWVAQAGIGGNHGSQAYGGDRWILDSGTITGTARADGNGYENVTLNGVIRQIVANPPAVGTVGVNTISGTATATYADGEITITSSGGVLKDVWLYEGTYENGAAPKYQPKGYGAELAECLQYYWRLISIPGVAFPGYAFGASIIRATIQTPVQMRTLPSVSIADLARMDTYTVSGVLKPQNFTVLGYAKKPYVVLVFTYSSGTTVNTPVTVRSDTIIELVADLE